jgi:hypothetical protein
LGWGYARNKFYDTGAKLGKTGESQKCIKKIRKWKENGEK